MNIPFTQTPNYTQGRPRSPYVFVIHRMDGTFEGTHSWFLQSKSQASSHYTVAFDGRGRQYSHSENTTWTNGLGWVNGSPAYYNPKIKKWITLDINRLAKCVRDNKGINPNGYTITIELEGRTGDPITDAMYSTIRYIIDMECKKWNIKGINRDTLIGHYEIDYVNRANCPGKNFDFERVIREVNSQLNNVQPQQPVLGGGDVRYVVVQNGWGLSDIALASGYTNYDSADSWRKIAELNGYSDWPSFNKSLKVGQKVIVERLNNIPQQEDKKMEEQIKGLQNQVSLKDGEIISLKELQVQLTNDNIELRKVNIEHQKNIDELNIKVNKLSEDVSRLIAESNKKDEEIRVRDIKINELEITISAFNKSPNKAIEREVLNNTPNGELSTLPKPWMAIWKKFQNTEKLRSVRMFFTHFDKDLVGIASLWFFTYLPSFLDRFFSVGIHEFLEPDMARQITEWWLILRVPATAWLVKKKSDAMQNSQEIAKRLNNSFLSSILIPTLEDKK